MEQSIASPQVRIDVAGPRGRGWRSTLAGWGSLLSAVAYRFAPRNWLLRRRIGAGMSSSLNIDTLASRLAVTRRGRIDGSDELPLSSEEVISGTQREIVVYFKQLQRNAQQAATNLAARLHELGAQLDMTEAAGRLRDIPSRCENAVLRYTAEYQSRLDLLGEREHHLRKRYEDICAGEELSQVKGSATSLFPRFALLALLLAAAALGVSRVIAAGIGVEALLPPSAAAAIAMLAVIMPLLMAIAVARSISNDGQLKRLAGWLMAAITLVFISILAACTFYYITAIIANPTLTVNDILDALLLEATRIGADAAAWIGQVSALAPKPGYIVVVLAGLLAFMMGYRFDGHKTGLGSLSRAADRVRDRRNRLTRRLRKRINAMVDRAEVEVTVLQSQLKSRAREYARLSDVSRSIPMKLQDYDVALEDACNILLDRYRAANVHVRRTEVPVSFSEHICFRQEKDLDKSTFRGAARQLDELQAGIAGLEGEIAQVRQKLRDINWNAISSLEHDAAAA